MKKKIISQVLSLVLLITVIMVSTPKLIANAALLTQEKSDLTINTVTTFSGNSYQINYNADLTVETRKGYGVVTIDVNTAYFNLISGAKVVLTAGSDDTVNPRKLAMYREDDTEHKEPIYVKLFNQDTYKNAVKAANGKLSAAHIALLKSHDPTKAVTCEYPYNFVDLYNKLETDEEKNDARKKNIYAVVDFLDSDYMQRTYGSYIGNLRIVATIERIATDN